MKTQWVLLASVVASLASSSAFATIPLTFTTALGGPASDRSGPVQSISINPEGFRLVVPAFLGTAPITVPFDNRLEATALQAFVDGRTGAKSGDIEILESGQISLKNNTTGTTIPLSQFALQWQSTQQTAADSKKSSGELTKECAEDAGAAALMSFANAASDLKIDFDSLTDRLAGLPASDPGEREIASDYADSTGKYSRDMVNQCDDLYDRGASYASNEASKIENALTSSSNGSQVPMIAPVHVLGGEVYPAR